MTTEKAHVELLYKLQGLINEMISLAEQDNDFNELLGELNQQQNLFGASLDEYDIYEFINNKLR